MQKMIKKIGWSIKNTIAGPKNLIFRAMDIPLKPKWVVFMVTDRCNSRCLHCNIWRQKPIENPLTPEEIEKTFKDELFKNVEYVLCTGGEPTVRSDLEEIILRIHKSLPKATIQLSTNAILAERALNVTKKAMAENINFDVGVSLDGVGEEHDRLRGVKGNFEKADYLLQELVKLREKHKDKLRVAAGIVISDFTLHSLKDVRSYAKKLNVDLVEAWYNEASFYNNIGKNEFKEQFVKAVSSQPSCPLQDKWLKGLKGRPMRFPCFAINTFCVLKCNGDIVPCLNLWDAKIGNIRESSPTKIWHSPTAKKVRKTIKNCQGCLNTWGVEWSFASGAYPFLLFGLKHPRALLERLKKYNF